MNGCTYKIYNVRVLFGEQAKLNFYILHCFHFTSKVDVDPRTMCDLYALIGFLASLGKNMAHTLNKDY